MKPFEFVVKSYFYRDGVSYVYSVMTDGTEYIAFDSFTRDAVAFSSLEKATSYLCGIMQGEF